MGVCMQRITLEAQLRLFDGICPVCSGADFEQNLVLWSDLISEWQLSHYEVDYINRQQGFHCKSCRNNLRSLGLASAILREFRYEGSLDQFVEMCSDLSVLEINKAGALTPILKKLRKHRLIEYPTYDMLDLDIQSGSFDLILHSDTLEHVPNPERGLSECHRVLRAKGVCIFTVPVVVDRMTRSRVGLARSYHGRSGVAENDQEVVTEFGADVWKTVLLAGFSSCEIYSFEYPAALVLIARK